MSQQENLQDNNTMANLRTLLEQHWDHARHLESERAWFMNAYAVVIGGVLAFIIGMKVEDISNLVTSKLFQFFVIFLVGLTFFGFIHTIRWTYSFECHRIKINKLATIIWLKSKSKMSLDPTMDIPAMHVLPEFTWGGKIAKFLQNFINGVFRTRYLYPLIYFSILVVLTILFNSVVGFPGWIRWLAIVVTVLTFLLGIRWHFVLKGIAKIKKMVLEGCNGEWAKKCYLPVLVEKAAQGDIELWAVDIGENIESCSDKVDGEWQVARSQNKAYYLNKNIDVEIYNELSGVDYVFILTPDRFHSEIASSWLGKLASGGKIFIEKPLDASLEPALKLHEEVEAKGRKEAVFAFDHYLARIYPLLKHLIKIGELKKIEFHLLEASKIPMKREKTLYMGMIFDLFCHVLALVYAVVSKDFPCLVTKFPNIILESVKGARYNNCSINGETFALIEFTVNNVKVNSVVGKCIGDSDDKYMKLWGLNGSIKVCLQAEHSEFFVLDLQEVEYERGVLNTNHVGNFLERILETKKHPLSIPGVLSLDSAFEILKILDKAKNRVVKKVPEYQCGDSLNEILGILGERNI